MTPHSPVPPPLRPHRWQFVALTVGLIATAAVAIAGVVIALSRPTHSVVTYSAEEKAEAKTQLCERYKLAGHAMHIETSDPDGQAALARVALSNGALMLYAASQDPALEANDRDAARALASSYQTTAALGTAGMATRDQYLASVDDMNAKDRVMTALCSE
ncbi:MULTISPECIES: hypothetical protein [Mycolicibacter]|uniref:hypothetical protein n=1 Tax=Mycolicibacter TaxID=1073531 RepID=UPI0007EF61A1|nr:MULTISPECIES: hypothetical protein [Mycolicibacter]OBJ28510.1 hypothetical protein A5631_20715 [Mycolicibacter heraklionensis]ULP47676.1 hypothetical protein MJO54_00350 [Mycolicibacter virginiensis]